MYSGYEISAHEFQSVAAILASGGKVGHFAKFNELGSNRWFTLELREDSLGDREFALRIPRAVIEGTDLEKVGAKYRAHGFLFEAQSNENTSIAAEVLIPVTTEDREHLGVKPQHAIRLLLVEMGDPLPSKWRVRYGS